MEKVIYLLMGPPDGVSESLAETLCGEVVIGLRSRKASRIQINLTDPSLGDPFGVEPDTDSDGIVAVVSMWVDSAEASRVASVLPTAGESGAKWDGYLVSEAEPVPLRPESHPVDPSGRVPGFAQMMALRKPSHLSWAEWRRTWQGSHTPVAVNTQSSFRFVQNVVLRALTPKAPPYAAVVEECFPIDAAKDLHVFFDSGGDEAKLSRHMAAMSESCDRFMDGAAPVAWTTEYQFP